MLSPFERLTFPARSGVPAWVIAGVWVVSGPALAGPSLEEVVQLHRHAWAGEPPDAQTAPPADTATLSMAPRGCRARTGWPVRRGVKPACSGNWPAKPPRDGAGVSAAWRWNRSRIASTSRAAS